MPTELEALAYWPATYYLHYYRTDPDTATTMTTLVKSSSSIPGTSTLGAPGLRKNGKQWHTTKRPFRPNAGQTPYDKRLAARQAQTAMKAKEKEMKEEKEEERQRSMQRIKDKRAAKEEKERYEKMAEKMHRKRVERLKRREKRNKMLNS